MEVKMAVSTLICKQTISPLLLRMRYFNYSCILNKASNITKFQSSNSANSENIVMSKITRFCKPNTGKIISKTTNFVEKSFIPIRFKPEPSMHYPPCNDFSKTRLHSLPLTRILENLGTNLTPRCPFLGNFRWYGDARRTGKPKRSKVSKDKVSKKKKKYNENYGVFYKTMKSSSLNEYRDLLKEKAAKSSESATKEGRKARPIRPS